MSTRPQLAPYAVNLGFQTGFANQFSGAIAIGESAGLTGQRSRSIAIGPSAGQMGQGGQSIALGFLAGNTGQFDIATAIGPYAGQADQRERAVALGYACGRFIQGTGAIAFGYYAGCLEQGAEAVALGIGTAFTGQKATAISLGPYAGRENQGTGAIAIGLNAAYYNQSPYAIAIGTRAGETNQAVNSIILNAASTALNASASGCYINPVNAFTGMSTAYQAVSYNPSTRELVSNSGVLVKAFASFVGTNAAGTSSTIQSSYNVSSVTRQADSSFTIQYTISFTNPMPDAFYAVVGCGTNRGDSAAVANEPCCLSYSARTTSNFIIWNGGIRNGYNGFAPANATVVVYR